MNAELLLFLIQKFRFGLFEAMCGDIEHLELESAKLLFPDCKGVSEFPKVPFYAVSDDGTDSGIVALYIDEVHLFYIIDDKERYDMIKLSRMNSFIEQYKIAAKTDSVKFTIYVDPLFPSIKSIARLLDVDSSVLEYVESLIPFLPIKNSWMHLIALQRRDWFPSNLSLVRVLPIRHTYIAWIPYWPLSIVSFDRYYYNLL